MKEIILRVPEELHEALKTRKLKIGSSCWRRAVHPPRLGRRV